MTGARRRLTRRWSVHLACSDERKMDSAVRRTAASPSFSQEFPPSALGHPWRSPLVPQAPHRHRPRNDCIEHVSGRCARACRLPSVSATAARSTPTVARARRSGLRLAPLVVANSRRGPSSPRRTCAGARSRSSNGLDREAQPRTGRSAAEDRQPPPGKGTRYDRRGQDPSASRTPGSTSSAAVRTLARSWHAPARHIRYAFTFLVWTMSRHGWRRQICCPPIRAF